VESRAAMTTISAHETIPGQTFSNLDLILATTLYPLTELLFGPAPCSPLKVAVSSRSIDASQPCWECHVINIHINVQKIHLKHTSHLES
jgi:hypothetical protein